MKTIWQKEDSGTRRERIRFPFYDRKGISSWLKDQAKCGWIPESIRDMTIVFRKAEPQAIRFTLTYFPKDTLFSPEPTEEMARFTELCRHAGWTYLMENRQFQIFSNTDPDAVPVYTDAEMEVDQIHRGYKKSQLPLLLTALVLDVF
ncbi:MAG: DUF2812 domain-containing protein [Anaerovoracaceae bacterium]|jgi:hypothetical protein